MHSMSEVISVLSNPLRRMDWNPPGVSVMGFRQEYWHEFAMNLPGLGIKLPSPVIGRWILTTKPTGKPT